MTDRYHRGTHLESAPDPPGAQGESQDNQSAGELFAEVYSSLKGLAHKVRAGRGNETLGTTALVHEAYLKLSGKDPLIWKDEAHFFAIAARAMRQILMDAARHDLALKRGGGREALPYQDTLYTSPVRPDVMLALDEALEGLALLDARCALVVEHRIFVGLSIAESARLLGVSTSTIERDWRAARAYLAIELGPDLDAVAPSPEHQE